MYLSKCLIPPGEKYVANLGRSAVFRKLAAEYLKRKKEQEIASLYVRAYRHKNAGIADEFDEWESEGVWPEQ